MALQSVNGVADARLPAGKATARLARCVLRDFCFYFFDDLIFRRDLSSAGGGVREIFVGTRYGLSMLLC